MLTIVAIKLFGVYSCVFSLWHCLCRIVVEIGAAFRLVCVVCSVRLVCSVAVLKFSL